jgi:iron(III) transport system permease protein
VGGLIVVGAAAIAAAFVLPPLLQVAWQLASVDAASLRPLVQLRIWTLLARSVAMAGMVTLLALIAGVPLGLVFARARFPFRSLLLAVHLLPMLLPPFIPALGWFHLLGRGGAFGSAATSAFLFSLPGLVLVLWTVFTPVVTTLTLLGVRGLDASLEEAGRLAARPLTVGLRLLVPAAWPAIALGAVLVFTLAFSEVAVPMLLRVDVYPAAVFARLGGLSFAPAEAAVLVLPLLPVAVLLFAAERWLIGARPFDVMGLRQEPPRPLFSGGGAVLAAAFCSGAAVISVLPMATLLRRAAGVGAGEVLAWARSSPWTGLTSGALAATIALGIALPLGHGLARGSRAARLADGILAAGFFVPSAVLGVGLIAAWNRPWSSWLYGSTLILVTGFVARYAVIAERAVAASVRQSAPSLEEAASVAGAGYLRRLSLVVAPLHLRGLAAAWLLVFAFSLRDLETAVMYYPPDGEPLTVRIFTLEANGPPAVVAALALLHAGLTTVLLAAALLLVRWRRP